METVARQPTILIADNDRASLRNLTHYFQRRGNRVIPAPNLEATEVVLENNLKELDAAILDGRMEFEDSDRDRSGWELAERTADENPEDLIPIFIHSRVEPQSNPYAGAESGERHPRPNIFEVPKSKGMVELGKCVNEQIEKKIEREKQQSIWSKQHRALVALIALLMSLFCGLGAVVLGESKLLLAAVVSAVVAVVFVSFTLD